MTSAAPDAPEPGSFSPAAPWRVDPAAMTWRTGIDARRRAARHRVPQVIRPRTLPPGARVVRVAGSLGWAVARWRMTGRRRGGSESRADISRRLRGSMERLGPTYIKLAQIISAGEGVFPVELVSEFRRCRDQVPPEPFSHVRRTVEEDLGQPLEALFAEFDESPLAAASIAQVHRAVLRDGPAGTGPVEVVVKVQRPTVATMVGKDLRAMAWLAPFLVGRIKVAALANPPALVEVFADTIVEELDFRLEAQNMLDVARSFAELGQDAFVVPRPHPQLVTRRVLVMERLAGFAFDQVPDMRAAGVDTHAVVRSQMIGFFEGCMIHGVFHGDLHGGNLFVTPEGRTALLDFGIVGRLSPAGRLAFLRLIVTATTNDIKGQLAAIRDLGALPPDTDLDAVIADLGLDQTPVDPTTLSREELVAEVNRVVKALLGYGARMPKELMLYAKNLVFLDGAIAHFAPEVDLFAEITHLVTYFAQTHGARIAADVGMDPTTYRPDLSGMKASLGVDPDTPTLTYAELKARRELIRKRLAASS